MKTGKYKSQKEEIFDVVQVDEENKKVLVYIGDEPQWFGEEVYSTWEEASPSSITENALPDTNEMYVDPKTEEEEIVSDTLVNPIDELPRKRKRTPIKKAKKSPPKKGKK